MSDQQRKRDPRVPRYPGTTWSDVVDADTQPLPDELRYDINDFIGDEDLSIDRYISKDWHDREVDKLWNRTWQFAARTEQIPEVGDHVLYEIVGTSLMIMRTGPDEIKAYYNACLHRGRKLRATEGRISEIRCPFHSFAWNLDGTLKDLPCAWDFPQVNQETFTLPEARVAVWQGFIFITMDENAEPFEHFMGAMGKDWQRWDYGSRYTYFHIAGIIDCNWKVALEAFLESYHVIGTHPQLMPWMGDANSHYDVLADEPNWNRSITPQGVPSPHIADGLSEQDVLESYYETREFYTAGTGRDLQADGEVPELPVGVTARVELARQLREQLAKGFDRPFDTATESELIDGIQYFLFPNFCVFGGDRTNAVYRFRPSGNNPDQCIAEVLLLSLPKPGVATPRPAEVRWLQEGEQFSDITELGLLGPVLDQDYFNLPYIQEGLHTTRKPGVTLALYQESRIRHYQKTLEEWLARD